MFSNIKKSCSISRKTIGSNILQVFRKLSTQMAEIWKIKVEISKKHENRNSHVFPDLPKWHISKSSFKGVLDKSGVSGVQRI